jgi:hypothetical protein
MTIGEIRVLEMRNMINKFKSIMEQEEKNEITVINNVDVKINSSDKMDLNLSDEEKNKITQLIDSFHSEVSNIVDFTDLVIYSNSTKLTGVIPQINVHFTFSSGDDEGLFLTNINTLKISPDIMEVIQKLMKFQEKYKDTTEFLIRNRKEN